MPGARSRKRAIVVGAGVGGLVAAIGLAAAGVAVEPFERVATPDGKLREVAVRETQLDARLTAFTLRWGFEGAFDRVLGAERLPMRPTVEVCAQDRDDRGNWTPRDATVGGTSPRSRASGSRSSRRPHGGPVPVISAPTRATSLWKKASAAGAGRAPTDEERRHLLYGARSRGDSETPLAPHVAPRGQIEAFAAPPPVALPHSRVWRSARCEPRFAARIDRTLEDPPFHVSSFLRSQLLAREVHSVHESLTLDRFATDWAQGMLPFRIPRVIW